MILVMVLLGGVTRLQHAGLSIVEWKPIVGILPPLNDAEWDSAFKQYQQFPEYKKLNQHMNLTGFKSIFWLEYLHRLWGRIIGLAFLGPFIYFLLKGRLSETLLPSISGILLLGGLQGFMGWYMVKSGLVDRPDVSQYRLTMHLMLALLLYGWTFWVALDIMHPRPHYGGGWSLRFTSRLLTLLVFVTALSGGFVAGLDAGFAYNTFPLMKGQLIPDGILKLHPAYLNFFENKLTVQFDHRFLAITTFCAVVLTWFLGMTTALLSRTRLAFHCLLLAGIVQVVLGITTLVMFVPLTLGVLHQLGAFMLFTMALWVQHELRRRERVI
jgi:heme a synthase